MLEGAVIALVFFLLGRFLPGRRRGRKPVEAVCGCRHHHSFHDPQTRACAYAERRYLGNGRYGPPERCPCRQYAGPEPLPEYYAPEIAGEAGQ